MSFSTATGFSSQKMEALCELNSPMVFVQRDRLLTMAIFHTGWSGHTHYEDLTPSLYSGCMAMQDQDNGMMHNTLFFYTFLTALFSAVLRCQMHKYDSLRWKHTSVQPWYWNGRTTLW